MFTITAIIPVLNRPKNVSTFINSILDKSPKDKVEILFVTDKSCVDEINEINKDFENDSALEKLSTISEKSKFISSKILISKGKQFSCKANHTLNKHLDNSDECVILSREFEKEIEFFKIYNPEYIKI